MSPFVSVCFAFIFRIEIVWFSGTEVYLCVDTTASFAGPLAKVAVLSDALVNVRDFRTVKIATETASLHSSASVRGAGGGGGEHLI